MNYATVIRLGLLLIAFLIVVFFIYRLDRKEDDKDNDDDSKEAFINPSEPFVVVEEETNEEDLILESEISTEHKEAISNTYKEHLNRPPTVTELVSSFYAYSNNNYDIDSVINLIKFTDEYRNKEAAKATGRDTEAIKDVLSSSFVTADQSLTHSMSFQQQLDIYETIQEVFTEVLARLPTDDELNRFYDIMVNDATFDRKKLTSNLQASNEYLRLRKLQSNLVYSELPGQLTDAQITLKIHMMYEDVFRTRPDKEMMGFLKARFTMYNLNETKFKRFLMLLKNFDEQLQNGNDKNGYDAQTTHSTRAAGAQQPYLQIDRSHLLHPSNETLLSLLKTIAEQQAKTNANTPTAHNAAATSQNGQSYDVNACERELDAENHKSTTMSDYMHKRNSDQQGSMCARNSYYMRVDNLLGYDGNKAPRAPEDLQCDVCPFEEQYGMYGTSITDAAKTQNGSIMPRFSYREDPLLRQ